MGDCSLQYGASRPAKVRDKSVSTKFSGGFAAVGEPNVGRFPGTEVPFKNEVECRLFRARRNWRSKSALLLSPNRVRPGGVVGEIEVVAEVKRKPHRDDSARDKRERTLQENALDELSRIRFRRPIRFQSSSRHRLPLTATDDGRRNQRQSPVASG
jgi:hypothetical protein